MKSFIKKTGVIILVAVFVFGLAQQSFAQSTQLEPVVIIPGIMGSWNWEVMLQRSGAGVWDFLAIDHTWDNMINALENAGYEKDKTLFISFYDWRQSNINSATDYLIPTIDKALINSPTGKVNIVAHSMGGLVARRYIESGGYRDDVNQFVLLGTPNYGSSDVYTLWEGGAVPNNWSGKEKLGINFYLWYMTTATTQTPDNYDTIHTYIPSIKDMLPTYNFLVDSDGNTKWYYDLTEARNSFLENLNGSMMRNLQKVGNITVIAGNGESTVKNIPVVARPESETKLWTDGVPEPMPPARDAASGDNRVLLTSAKLNKWSIVPPVPVLNDWQKLFAKIFPIAYAAYEGDIDEFLKQKEITSKHGDLPTTAISDVFTTLALTQPTIAYVPPQEPDNITSFWFASPVQVKITDPQDRTITKDLNNIPGAVYTGESDPNGVKMIIIPNDISGQYKIELTGTENGKYHMAATNFTNISDNIVTAEKSIAKGEKVEYTANIDTSSPTPIVISEPIITNPKPEKTPVELTKDLIASLDSYYKANQIKEKGIYQSLSNDLKIVLISLQEIETTRPIGEKYPKFHELKIALAKKLATSKLNNFINKINTQSKNNKIDKTAASDLITQANIIITEINK